MRLIAILLLCMAAYSAYACQSELLDHTVRRLASSESINLCHEYSGKVLLVVNTASKCGNTPQYEGLEKLQREYAEQGLVVLGFPSNDFFGQEPGTEEEIQDFCRLTYNVQFPMFEKIHVKEKKAHPLYARLAQSAGNYPKWNFHKYLIGRDGNLIAQFSPRTKPYDKRIITNIENALAN